MNSEKFPLGSSGLEPEAGSALAYSHQPMARHHVEILAEIAPRGIAEHRALDDRNEYSGGFSFELPLLRLEDRVLADDRPDEPPGMRSIPCGLPFRASSFSADAAVKPRSL